MECRVPRLNRREAPTDLFATLHSVECGRKTRESLPHPVEEVAEDGVGQAARLSTGDRPWPAAARGHYLPRLDSPSRSTPSRWTIGVAVRRKAPIDPAFCVPYLVRKSESSAFSAWRCGMVRLPRGFGSKGAMRSYCASVSSIGPSRPTAYPNNILPACVLKVNRP